MVGLESKLIPTLRPFEVVEEFLSSTPSTPSTSSTSLSLPLSKILMEIRNRFNSLVEIEQIIFLIR